MIPYHNQTYKTGVWKMVVKQPTVKELKETIDDLKKQVTYLNDARMAQNRIIDKDECLTKLELSEPIFTLRGRDRLAPMIIRLWADLTATQAGSIDKAKDGYRKAEFFDRWAQENKSKFPD